MIEVEKEMNRLKLLHNSFSGKIKYVFIHLLDS
jgi:hypothetical protein